VAPLYPRVPLGDVARVKSGYAYKRGDWTDSGVPVVKIQNVRDGWVTTEGASLVSEATAARTSSFRLSIGDVLITMSGEIGAVGRVRAPEPLMLNQRVGRFEITAPDKLDDIFLLHVLRAPNSKALLLNAAHGAAQANISPTLIGMLEIPLPALATQRKIAAVLSAYDDLIENNNRRIKILEEMAQRVYREWFVDFRYPGHEGVPLVDSEGGRIPEGWRYEALSGVVDCIRDTVRPGVATVDDPYVPIDCIDAKSLCLGRWEPGENAKSSLLRFASRDVLFGAMRPYFHKVAIAPWSGTTRSTCFVLRPKDMDMWAFAVMALFDDRTVDFATRHSSGSTIPYAKWAGAVADMPTLVPPAPIACAFGQVVDPILAFLTQAGIVNATLASARDLLLPRLVSGEIDVTDLDIAMPEAA
jgi:type I restriction enzyme S subunit